MFFNLYAQWLDIFYGFIKRGWFWTLKTFGWTMEQDPKNKFSDVVIFLDPQKYFFGEIGKTISLFFNFLFPFLHSLVNSTQ